MKITVVGACCVFLMSFSLTACEGGSPCRGGHRQRLLVERIIGPEHPHYHEFMADYRQVAHDGGMDDFTFIGYLIKKHNILLPENVELPELLGFSSFRDAKTDEARAKEVVYSILPTESFDLKKAALYAAKLQESMAVANQFGIPASKDYDQALAYLQRVAAQQQR